MRTRTADAEHARAMGERYPDTHVRTEKESPTTLLAPVDYHRQERHYWLGSAPTLSGDQAQAVELVGRVADFKHDNVYRRRARALFRNGKTPARPRCNGRANVWSRRVAIAALSG
ncbi:MAG: hypothetical protein U0531_02870 [Dehalococcoidia bacterium]